MMENKITQAGIRAFLKENNVPIVGFTKPLRDEKLNKLIEDHNQQGQYIYFGDIAIEQRQNFEAVFPVCEDVIVVGIPYNSRNSMPCSKADSCDGFISNMAWEYDYHDVVKVKLNLLSEYLKGLDPGIETLIQVDTGPLIDRHIGYQAGLGSYAKNQGLMHLDYGTEFYIGYLLVNRAIGLAEGMGVQTLPVRTDRCHNCDLCVRACPARALTMDYEFYGQRCISYLTQKKEYLNWEERKLISTFVYGCDCCQLVCPYNHNAIPLEYQRQSRNGIDLKGILTISNKQLVKNYKHTGFAWRGAKVLKRNAIIAIGNRGRSEDIAFLDDLLDQATVYYIPYLLWAIYQCGACDMELRCEKVLKKFENETVKIECQSILQLIK